MNARYRFMILVNIEMMYNQLFNPKWFVPAGQGSLALSSCQTAPGVQGLCGGGFLATAPSTDCCSDLSQKYACYRAQITLKTYQRLPWTNMYDPDTFGSITCCINCHNLRQKKSVILRGQQPQWVGVNYVITLCVVPVSVTFTQHHPSAKSKIDQLSKFESAGKLQKQNLSYSTVSDSLFSISRKYSTGKDQMSVHYHDSVTGKWEWQVVFSLLLFIVGCLHSYHSLIDIVPSTQLHQHLQNMIHAGWSASSRQYIHV